MGSSLSLWSVVRLIGVGAVFPLGRDVRPRDDPGWLEAWLGALRVPLLIVLEVGTIVGFVELVLSDLHCIVPCPYLRQ